MSGLVPKGMPGKSLPVITPITPGSALALLVSIFRMRAWATGLLQYLTVEHARGRQVGSITRGPRSLHPGVLSFHGLPYDLVILHHYLLRVYSRHLRSSPGPIRRKERQVYRHAVAVVQERIHPSTRPKKVHPFTSTSQPSSSAAPFVTRICTELVERLEISFKSSARTDVPVEIDRPQVRVSEEHEIRIECYGHVCECLFLQSALNVRARSLRCRQSRACGRASGPPRGAWAR